MAQHTRPIMNYDISVNGRSVSLGSNSKVSDKDGYNTAGVTCTCTNQSWNKFQIWVTEASNENWGLEIGKKITLNRAETGGFQQNKAYAFSFTVTKDIFTEDGTYRLALCSRGDLDMSWDVTEVLFVITTGDNQKFKPTDGDAVELTKVTTN